MQLNPASLPDPYSCNKNPYFAHTNFASIADLAIFPSIHLVDQSQLKAQRQNLSPL
jgi:hypothetical protein